MGHSFKIQSQLSNRIREWKRGQTESKFQRVYSNGCRKMLTDSNGRKFKYGMK